MLHGGISQTIHVFLIGILSLVGIPLNIHGAYKLLKAYCHRRSLSVFLLLKLHLSFADLLILTVYNLGSLTWTFTESWYGGRTLCKLFPAGNTFSFYLSSNIIACIATERLIVMCQSYPALSRLRDSRFGFGVQRAKLLLTAGYGMALTCAIPHFFTWEIIETLGGNGTGALYQCTDVWYKWKWEKCLDISFARLTMNDSQNLEETWLEMLQGCIYNPSVMSQTSKTAFNLFHLLFVFWFPCIIVLISSVVILRSLSRRMHRQSSIANSITRANVHANRRLLGPIRAQSCGRIRTSRSSDRRSSTPRPAYAYSSAAIHLANRSTIMYSATLKRTMCLCAAYILCWLPYNAIVLGELFSSKWFSEHVSYADFLKQLLVVNAALNPLIYRAPHRTVRVGSGYSHRTGSRTPSVGNSPPAPNGDSPEVGDSNFMTIFPLTHALRIRELRSSEAQSTVSGIIFNGTASYV